MSGSDPKQTLAIMLEGEIVQLGTAEKLVINPATNHVREFPRDIRKGKLMTVGSVMGAPAAVCGNRFSINPFDPYKCGKFIDKRLTRGGRDVSPRSNGRATAARGQSLLLSAARISRRYSRSLSAT